jgi:3-isopropylmalate/(R)-2-methylmalate dehydratase large subunit
VGKTISDKIIARASGKPEVYPGEIVWVTPDLTTGYNYLGLDYVTPDLETLGVNELKNPVSIALFIDHHIPPRSAAEAGTYHRMRNWARKYGAQLHEGMGIGHQVMMELGLVRPGMLVASHDTQVTGAGGVGALAIGALPLLEIYTRGKTWIKVPATIRYNIRGEIPRGVMARDIMHMIVSEIGPDGALYKTMEFGGPTLSAMGIDERITLCNIANHPGAKAAIVNPDEKAISYVKGRSENAFEAVASDPDAEYQQILNFDISSLEPYVAAPSEVYNCKPLHQVEGTRVDMGYIGSCAGGRMADLGAAASILKGKQIKPGFKLYVVPTSQDILRQASRKGLIETFIEAGASVFPPTCDFCWGALGAMAAGQTAITTGTLNIAGRMGSNDAGIFLANAYSVAAAAIEGRITDPRNYL